MTCLAVEPCSKRVEGGVEVCDKSTWDQIKLINKIKITLHLFTSSALCAIKNPCVFAKIFAPRGFMDILLSLPSSPPLISIASNNNLSLMKQSLAERCGRERKLINLTRNEMKYEKVRKILFNHYKISSMHEHCFSIIACKNKRKTFNNRKSRGWTLSLIF